MLDFKRSNNQKSKSYRPSPEIEAILAEQGKVPPQAIDLEEVVLGALMIEKGVVVDVLDIIKPESFYKESHQKIYAAIVGLSEAYEPIDIMTVTEKLRRNGHLEEVGGSIYLVNLTSRVDSAAHIEYHARIIAQKFIQRELIRFATDVHNRAYDISIDVNDLLDFSEQELFNIATGNIKKESLRIDSVIQEALRLIEEASKRTDGLSGVPSGFTDLDRLTSGWQPSDLIIIAARPSMGKTAFSLTMLRNMALDHRQPVAIFSLEMSTVQLVNRLIVAETGIAHDKIKTGRLADYEWEQLDHQIKELVEAPIFLDDTPAISIFELRAKCRRLKLQHDVKLIVVDYLQLMSGPPETRNNREQEVSMISRGLKAIAKELNVPVVALSQLNRSVEMRSGDKRPQLSDLRESGAIEQDADIVMFIHRPERMGILEDENGESTIGKAELIVAKHRNGAIQDIRLRFIAEQARFTDLDPVGLAPSGDFGGTGNVQKFSSKMNQSPLTHDPLSGPPGAMVPF